MFGQSESTKPLLLDFVAKLISLVDFTTCHYDTLTLSGHFSVMELGNHIIIPPS